MSPVSKQLKTKKGKVAIVAVVAMILQVLFPQTGDTILQVLSTFLGLVPELTLRS